MNEGKIYTKGNNFRARAVAHMRHYRAKVLNVPDDGEYGHILSNSDACKGHNFLSAVRYDILEEVARRSTKKGVDIARTCGNLLSSQAFCFNLFIPLKLDKVFAAEFFNQFIGSVDEVSDIIVEYTPSNEIFNDQSQFAGVDSDLLVRYKNNDGEPCILVLETKFVEKEFSTCGFKKKKKDSPDYCPDGQVISVNYNTCLYQAKKNYRYWERTEESGAFKLGQVVGKECPFGGPLWQLWVNQALASAIAKSEGVKNYKFVVLCPEANTDLTANGQVFSDFRQLLAREDVFQVVYMESILDYLRTKTSKIKWTQEFVERYTVKSPSIVLEETNEL
jgi:hypothetical protein